MRFLGRKKGGRGAANGGTDALQVIRFDLIMQQRVAAAAEEVVAGVLRRRRREAGALESPCAS